MTNQLIDRDPRPLGEQLRVAPLGLGCWRLVSKPDNELRAVIETGLDLGMNLVDTADVYGLNWGGSAFGEAELAEALSDLRAAGKIREVGVSNFTPAQHDALAAHLPFALASTQPQYSALHLDPLLDGTFDLCMRSGVLPLVWSPLGGGRLAVSADASSDTGVSAELLATLDRLAERENVDRATVALAFVLAHPAKPVALLGTQQPHRLEQLARAVNLHLDRNDVYDVIEASQGTRLP